MQRRKPFRIHWFPILLFLWLAVLVWNDLSPKERVEPLPYSVFLREVEMRRLAQVRIHPDRIEGRRFEPPLRQLRPFTTQRPEDPQLVERLQRAGVPFEAVPGGGFLRDLFSWFAPILVLGLFWWFVLGRAGRSQTQLGGIGRARAKVYVERDLQVRFKDVAGVDEAKVELQEVVEFLKSPGQFQRLGGRMPKGILLVGPPGTGKTLLARAVAGEANVPFFSINGSEFVEMFVGLGAARVRDLFEQARLAAPCIIFIDEMDALGKARGVGYIGGGANDEKEQTLNQLLAELDGFDPSRGIVLLAATNRPEILDPALLRSGRFDRQVLIDLPDRTGRAQILGIHLKKVKFHSDIRVEELAALTAGFSGADLENLVNEAALIATRRGAERVENRDFNEGIERIMGGLERRSRVMRPEEKRRVAFHELGHAVVSLVVDPGEAVHKVSIIPRGMGALGYTLRRPTEDRYLLDRAELEAKLCVLLGGRASETVFFKEVSTGAADDLDKATEIAKAMVTRYGMSQELGLMTYGRLASPFLSQELRLRSAEFSDETAHIIDQETLRLLEHAFAQAVRILRAHEEFLRHTAAVLFEQEVIDEHELKRAWTRHLEGTKAPVSLVETNQNGSGLASGLL